MSYDYSGRNVIVTGGTGALGTALVGALVEVGATCHVPYRSARDVENFALRQHAGVKLYPDIELSDEALVTRLFQGAGDVWASIHIAGGFSAKPVAETSKADLEQQLDTNLVSCFLCCRAAVNAMTRTGGGRIVNVAARPALEWRAGAGMTAYTASKAAVAAFTVALAEEVAGEGILVNAVAPSIMDTAVNRKSMPKADFEKWPKVEEVAATILFLASPDNKVTRGAIVPVYGKS